PEGGADVDVRRYGKPVHDARPPARPLAVRPDVCLPAPMGPLRRGARTAWYPVARIPGSDVPLRSRPGAAGAAGAPDCAGTHRHRSRLQLLRKCLRDPARTPGGTGGHRVDSRPLAVPDTDAEARTA